LIYQQLARKKVSAAFDGGRVTSDGGVMLLAQAERRLSIADQLARVIPNSDRIGWSVTSALEWEYQRLAAERAVRRSRG
jgi:hypothetical protein